MGVVGDAMSGMSEAMGGMAEAMETGGAMGSGEGQGQ